MAGFGVGRGFLIANYEDAFGEEWVGWFGWCVFR